MSKLIEISNITKRYGDIYAVKDCSFSLSSGDVLGFLGPNGAGKTTTMQMITGYQPPQSGTIKIDGYDIALNPKRVKASIGYVPEGSPLYEEMVVEDFLRFCGKIRGLEGESLKLRLEIVAKQLEISSILNRKIDTLSKGYRRRVGIAQALIDDPKILILDEPTDGLDPNQKQHIRELITQIKKEKAIIISTHILEEAEAMCNRVVIINQGSIVADSTPSELLMRLSNHLCVDIILKKEDREHFLKQFDQKEQSYFIVEELKDSTKIRVLREISSNLLIYINQKLSQASITPISMQQHHEKLETLFKEITQTKESSR
jgi:ABC-2 type transport system ATP-binding protein